jgi:hypothetical protein
LDSITNQTLRTLLVTFILLCGFAGTPYAQPPASSAALPREEQPTVRTGDYWRINNSDYWKGYLRDTKSILLSPARWERADWIKASLVIGITAGLYANDEDIKDWAQENQDETTDRIASLAEPFGNGKYTLPPMAMLYLYGHMDKNRKARRVAMLGLESFAVTGLFTQALKHSLHRHRPSGGDGAYVFDGPAFSTADLSFPSGHSSSVWSISTVVALEFRENAVVPPLAYGIATLTALSRINDNAHWASDAFFGSALGYFTARAVVALHNEKRLAVLPLTDGNHTGLLITYEF